MKLLNLQEIWKSYRERPVNSAHEQVEILVEAVAIRTSQMKQHNNLQDTEISVRLLADLQDIQDKEVVNISKELDKKVGDVHAFWSSLWEKRFRSKCSPENIVFTFKT